MVNAEPRDWQTRAFVLLWISRVTWLELTNKSTRLKIDVFMSKNRKRGVNKHGCRKWPRCVRSALWQICRNPEERTARHTDPRFRKLSRYSFNCHILLTNHANRELFSTAQVKPCITYALYWLNFQLYRAIIHLWHVS